MRDYELTVLLKPDLKDKELDKTVNDLQALLEKNGAKVKSRKDPAKKILAYEIKKVREAFYVYFELEISPEKTAVVDEKLKLDEKVLRYLLVNHVR